MKTLKIIFPMGMLLLSCFLVQAEGKKKEKGDPEAFTKVIELIESKVFYVEVTDAFPTGNSSITVNTKYGTNRLGGDGHVSLANNRGEVMMMDTIATGRLPFFGRAYSIPYGEGGGIEFEKAKIQRESLSIVNRKKKQYVEYKFSIPGRNDRFDFYMEIYPGGNCTVKVNSNNRASIAYGGMVLPMPEEKAAIYMHKD